MKLNDYFRAFMFTVIGMSLATSCDDWTEPESVDLKYGTIENADPAGYENYLERLREYRSLPHKSVYAWFDNHGEAFASQGHRISALPDSIDVVVLANVESVTNQMLDEMKEARAKKGQQFSYCIDLDGIKGDYTALCEDLAAKQLAFFAENGEDAELPEELKTPDIVDYMAKTAQEKLAYFDAVGFDCLMAGFTGKSTNHLDKNELTEYNRQANAFLGIIGAWHARHKEVPLDIIGKPQNVDAATLGNVRTAFLSDGLTATNQDMFTYILLSAGDALPAERYGMVASSPLADGSDPKVGYLSDGTSAVEALGFWGAGSSVGAVGVFNVADDYFLTQGQYTSTRRMIQNVNPAAK